MNKLDLEKILIEDEEATFGNQQFWMDAGWYDVGNVQVWHGWDYAERSGDSEFGDGEAHNIYGSPEAIHVDRTMLPESEHTHFLNEFGTAYKVFAANRAYRARWSAPIHLTPGVYRIELDMTADWYVWEGKKVVPMDPKGARVELFIGEAGRGAFMFPKPLSRQRLTQDIVVKSAKEYDVGFGITNVYAIHNGGCFLQRFRLIRLGAIETVIEPSAPVVTQTAYEPVERPSGTYVFDPLEWSLYVAAYAFGLPCSAEYDVGDTRYLEAVNEAGNVRRFEATIGDWKNVRFADVPAGDRN